MSDVFYNSPLKILKISTISALKEDQFTENNQLRKLIGSVGLDVYLAMKDRNPLLPDVSLRFVKRNLKIGFKQETVGSWTVSYLLFRFRELPIRRQIFVFFQRSDIIDEDSKSFNTLMLLRSSLHQVHSVFLEWCSMCLGANTIVLPVILSSDICFHVLNQVHEGYDNVKALGDLTLEFRVKTLDNMLKNIKISFTNEELQKAVKHGHGQGSLSNILKTILQENTSINFSMLNLSLVTFSNIIAYKSEENSPATAFFYEGGLALVHGEGYTVYDVLIEIAEAVLTSGTETTGI